jgi:hypothetical protein
MCNLCKHFSTAFDVYFNQDYHISCQTGTAWRIPTCHIPPRLLVTFAFPICSIMLPFLPAVSCIFVSPTWPSSTKSCFLSCLPYPASLSLLPVPHLHNHASFPVCRILHLCLSYLSPSTQSCFLSYLPYPASLSLLPVPHLYNHASFSACRDLHICLSYLSPIYTIMSSYPVCLHVKGCNPANPASLSFFFFP